MARINSGRLTTIRTRHKINPQVFVESGTFHGKTTRVALAQFRDVYTIELHDQWYAEAVEQLAPLGARCLHGNSADIIPQLVASIAEPVCWYLDAHYFTTVPGVAGADLPLPLFAELDAIAQRVVADIIIVDDVHNFGKSTPTTEWENVSLDTIAARFPTVSEARVMWDQAVIYR